MGTLLNQNITVTDANQDGASLAYSLNTHVRINLLVNDANDHFKRIEVIRPGGNAVVFDFQWQDGMFSPSTPEGWNGRDANQTFVLRSLNAPGDDSGLNYALLFGNGIVQTFSGSLATVSDSSTGLTDSVYPSDFGGLPYVWLRRDLLCLAALQPEVRLDGWEPLKGGVPDH